MEKLLFCNLCGSEIVGYGNNPEPLSSHPSERCCDLCNFAYVLWARRMDSAAHMHMKQIRKAVQIIRGESA